MKLILDIEEQTLENMQGYCNHNGIKVSEMIEKLFNKYIQSPANIIDNIAYNNESDELNDFARLITEYLNEAILDIEELAESKESYEDDAKMAEVFKTMNREIVMDPYVITRLYKTFKEGN